MERREKEERGKRKRLNNKEATKEGKKMEEEKTVGRGGEVGKNETGRRKKARRVGVIVKIDGIALEKREAWEFAALFLDLSFLKRRHFQRRSFLGTFCALNGSDSPGTRTQLKRGRLSF